MRVRIGRTDGGTSVRPRRLRIRQVEATPTAPTTRPNAMSTSRLITGSLPTTNLNANAKPSNPTMIGSHSGARRSDCTPRTVNPSARIMLTAQIQLLVLSPFISQNIATSYAEQDEDPLNTVRVLLEPGGITPIVSHTYPLAEVPDAIRYMVEGNPVGRIVISVISTD